MEDREDGLYMPSGLKLKKEYFNGFGKKELIPTVISAGIFAIIDFIIFMCGVRVPMVLLSILVIGVTTVAFMQIKVELNLSPIDIVQLEVRFAKDQKFYPYVAKNEWKNTEE